MSWDSIRYVSTITVSTFTTSWVQWGNNIYLHFILSKDSCWNTMLTSFRGPNDLFLCMVILVHVNGYYFCWPSFYWTDDNPTNEIKNERCENESWSSTDSNLTHVIKKDANQTRFLSPIFDDESLWNMTQEKHYGWKSASIGRISIVWN